MKSKNAPQRAYETIRDQILDGTLEPGTRLTIRAMAKEANVSAISVIQALHRLENDGLVESFPQWGSRVIVLNRETVRDRVLLREAVECQVARILAEYIEPEHAEKVQALAEKLDDLMAQDPTGDEFWHLDQEFHQALAQYTDSHSLQKALEFISLFRLMQKTREQVALGRIERPADIHRSLANAIFSGDPDVAEKQMREHIRVSTRDWLFNRAM